jgi:TldD protein
METALTNIPFERLLKKALKNGGDFSEIYVEYKQGTSVVSEAKRIERFVSTTESGLGLRVVVGDRSAYAYTNDFSSLDELAETIAAAVRMDRFDSAISLEKRPVREILVS